MYWSELSPSSPDGFTTDSTVSAASPASVASAALTAVSTTRAMSVRVPASTRRSSVPGLTATRPAAPGSSPSPVWSTMPSRRLTSRSAYAAMRGSCVTSTTVVRCSRASRTS